ncbi:Similar to mam: Neurogenic protein mastermind (Drosophila melanogaster) [Cotesia congregata]|uniref:Similar to mam: Neurogenic protein mastermind (Drosophila melanogaster) n=1 Tax=Cotesia congregata TaxID=51543 RepID=A0A8J2EF24_COTCN|nr:Similar to mam: Neurogenic protein mastermind (Drosophila melanogaster) [Cotesia congregata]
MNKISLTKMLLFQQQKILKRTAEDLESSGGSTVEPNFGEPPVKVQCTQGQQHQHQQTQSSSSSGHHPMNQLPSGNNSSSSGQPAPGSTSSSNEGLTKFSVEIVQQLEFTTSAANSQAQQISTNVTVKALTNASVKSDLVNTSSPGPKADPSSRASSQGPGIGCVDIGNLVECKQEPDNDFVDLEQCAAAVVKDAAANGAGFPGFSDFIDETGDEMLNADTFKDLISEINDYPLMDEFDFDDKGIESLTVNHGSSGNSGNSVPGLSNGIKLEDDKDVHSHNHQNGVANGSLASNSSPGLGAQYSPRLPYSSLDFKSEIQSPAASTLKQMAEQHQNQQHKNQMGLGPFTPAGNPARGPASRSPYTEFPQFGNPEYLGSPGSNGTSGTGNQNAQNSVAASYHKSTSNPGFQSQASDMFANQAPFSGLGDMKRSQSMTGKPNMLGPSGYKQQYSPYGSPGSMPNHGSPGYPLPSRGAPGPGPNQGGSGPGPFTGSTPPRPPSGSGSATLQINQAQQLHISNPGHNIQGVEGVGGLREEG